MAEHLTVGELRASIADLPDDMRVVTWNGALATFEHAEFAIGGRVSEDPSGAIQAAEPRTMMKSYPVLWIGKA